MRTYLARWIVPIAAPPIANGAVTVHEGRILYVGARDGAPAADVVDVGDAVLLPGLVNVHTHLELTAMRGFLEELPFRRWVLRLTKARAAVLSPELLLASAKAGIAEGLMAGVTTFADTCESGVVLQALVEMGVRGIMYQEVFGPDPAQCDGAMAGLREKLARSRYRFTPDNLQKAHEARYGKALVDIVSMVKHAADEQQPLLTAPERVERAFAKVTAGLQFTPEQLRWLDRIREHMRTNLSIDREDFDLIPIFADIGGLPIVTRAFAAEWLDRLIRDLNSAIAA